MKTKEILANYLLASAFVAVIVLCTILIGGK